MKARHEWKHRISFCDTLSLRQRLRAVMEPDSHGEDGKYRVRSLYFDSPEDKALREKLDGVSRREKFRLRYYNGDLSTLHLEKKSKNGKLCTKLSAPISLYELELLLDGERDWMADSPPPLIRELYSKMLLEGLRPINVVDYMREAYVYGPGNVRVTLDYDIRSAFSPHDFPNAAAPSLTPPDAAIILEVKWDSFLPDIIRSAVTLPGRHSAPYSKYAACRAYK